jgi:hypothetical protein
MTRPIPKLGFQILLLEIGLALRQLKKLRAFIKACRIIQSRL